MAVVLDNLLGHLRQNTFGQSRRGSLQKRQSAAGGVKTTVKDCFNPRYTTFLQHFPVEFLSVFPDQRSVGGVRNNFFVSGKLKEICQCQTLF